MRLDDQRQSTNVEDRRGRGPALAIGGGGIGVLIIALGVMLCGGDPSSLLRQAGDQQVQQQAPASNAASQNDPNRKFIGAVMGNLEDGWRQILAQQSRTRYKDPKLVLFSGQVESACGYASAATGPFYCPGDQNLYLDFDFFNELKREFKSPGDFAQAYVVAHEFGHHIQNLMGTMDQVQRAGQNNRLSVALELQADCYAGVWANFAAKQGRLDKGDPEEALRAASQVGDDMIQRRTQGYVVPDSFTHGSAQQRMQWFTRGIQSGDMRQCQTFR